MKRKNWYLFLGVSVISLLTLSACGGETKSTSSPSTNTSTTSSISVPNVIGQDYKKATKLLESKGLKVYAVEQDASDILPTAGWNHSVKKGEVFSVNSVYDKNFDNPSLGSNDVTIEFAKSDYKFKSEEEKLAERQKIAEQESAKEKAEAIANGKLMSDEQFEVAKNQFNKEVEPWVGADKIYSSMTCEQKIGKFIATATYNATVPHTNIDPEMVENAKEEMLPYVAGLSSYNMSVEYKYLYYDNSEAFSITVSPQEIKDYADKYN